MKKIKRIVSTGFWDDRIVSDVFSPEDKYFMLYLLTNPHTTQLGIYELPISKAANELGYSQETVKVLLDRFESKYGMIKYSKASGEVAIKNYLRHSIIKGGKPVMDCLLKEEKQVKDKSLLRYIFENLDNYTDTLNATVVDFIVHLKESSKENNNINDNDNENENERIVPRIVNEPPQASTEPMKHRYGEYKNVLLADAELEKLRTEYPDYEERIERLSSYVASSGKKYKSHYATIRMWAKRDAEKSVNKTAKSKDDKNYDEIEKMVLGVK